MNINLLNEMGLSKLKIPVVTIIILIISLGGIYSQVPKNDMLLREIILKYDDSIMNFNVLLKKKSIKIDNNIMYYWYKSDQVFYNRGGYSGNLLHGKYLIYNKNNRLKVDGTYAYGLKSEAWKNWWDNGEIASVIQWKNGQKNGKAYFYDQNGNLTKQVTYKHDKLHGLALIYRSKNIEKIKYKEGIEIHPENKVKREKKAKIESSDKIGSKARVKKPDITLHKDSSRNDTLQEKKISFFNKIFRKSDQKDGNKPIAKNKPKSKSQKEQENAKEFDNPNNKQKKGVSGK